MSALKTLAAALLLGGSAMAMAANDGQARVNELLSSDPQYRETWEGVVKKEERLPEWVMNLSGTSEQQMNAVEEDGDKYLVGTLCESADKCLNHRLIVAFSFDKKDAYAMLVDGPKDCRPTSRQRDMPLPLPRKPDQGMQDLLMETLKKRSEVVLIRT